MHLLWGSGVGSTLSTRAGKGRSHWRGRASANHERRPWHCTSNDKFKHLKCMGKQGMRLIGCAGKLTTIVQRTTRALRAAAKNQIVHSLCQFTVTEGCGTPLTHVDLFPIDLMCSEACTMRRGVVTSTAA